MTSLRPAYVAFIALHDKTWELVMAALAVAFVAIGFASDQAPAEHRAALGTAEFALTLIFVAEFASRLLASYDRLRYLREHALDLVAMLPVARGLRLLRVVRAFAGVHRAFTGVDRLAKHRGLGTLVIAWFGTMFLCSSIFYAVESGVNPSLREPGDAVWWAIATITGGTAEVRAVTGEGRVVTAVLLVVGVALLTALTAVLVSFIVSRPGSTATRAARRLRELAALRDEGAITTAEFESLRTRYLRELAA